MKNKKAEIILPGDVNTREMMPGGMARFYHTNHMTLATWNFDPGTVLPSHNHPHEQMTSMISGQFEMTLDDEVFVLTPGTVVIIPPNVTHSGRALTECQLVDVFHPVREDFLP